MLCCVWEGGEFSKLKGKEKKNPPDEKKSAEGEEK